MDYDSRRRKQAQARGLCPVCRKTPVLAGKICESCKQNARETRQEQTAKKPAPLCLNCGRPVPRVPGKRGRPHNTCGLPECKIAVRKDRHRTTKRYGITPQEFQALLTEQDNRCAICKKPEELSREGSSPILSIDHDHETQKVRGLLCHRCNVGLGMFLNDPARLVEAAEYLKAA